MGDGESSTRQGLMLWLSSTDDLALVWDCWFHAYSCLHEWIGGSRGSPVGILATHRMKSASSYLITFLCCHLLL